MTAEARRRGYSVVLGQARGRADEAAALRDVLATQHCDATILLGDLRDERRLLAQVLGSELPVVAVAQGSRNPEVSVVNVDNAAGSRLALEYLYDLGHRRIAFVHGGWIGDARMRQASYRRFMRERGLPIPRGYEQASKNDLAGGLATVERLLDLPLRPPPCSRVVGFDDIPMAEFAIPSLTTVRQPIAEMARLTIDRVLAELVRRPAAQKLRLVQPSLASFNASHAPPRPTTDHLSDQIRSDQRTGDPRILMHDASRNGNSVRSSTPRLSLLSVRGDQIVDTAGASVRLRGTCIGGWMNMEDFIAGYPGSEHGLRSTMADVLGESKARFFFDRLLDYMFAEEDVVFLESLGANVVRLPLNYRHFESDMAPFGYHEAGFRRLDQALEWCAKHGLYVILDLHAVQGWQNSDWHSDNANRVSLFWDQQHFQDRFVALWEEFARRYRGNSTVAGYNIMNEPASNNPGGRFSDTYRPAWNKINAVYRRVVEAIRAIDPEHIVFLEGDYYSRLFREFEPPFAPNLVYSSHNYNTAGFGPGAYPEVGVGVGESGPNGWGCAYQERTFQAHEGTTYARSHRVPLWVGEFGAVYNGPADERPDRLRAMADQLDVFEGFGAHWTTWTYKDVGVMGMVELDPQSEYIERIAPILEAKRQLASDFWMRWLPSTPAKDRVRDLARLIEQTIGDPDIDPAGNEKYLNQAALAGYAATLMQPAYAKRFSGLSETEIDRVLQSFAFANCRPHRELNEVLRMRMALPASHPTRA